MSQNSVTSAVVLADEVERPPIFNWDLALAETDPRKLVLAARMGATLAHLVVEAIRLGGDTTGIPDDDLAVDVLQQVTLFNSHVCAKLAERLSGPEAVA